MDEAVPPVEMGRIAAQSAKQVILQKVREAERDRQYEEFKDRVGTIINGIVKREEYGNIIVDVGRGEAILRRNEKIGRESYRNGDRIRCYIKDVRREARGPQIFLSRTAPEFMAELFKMEVPEIYDGIIEIKAVARDPGSRAKIAVISYDSSIDPVGACVGMRGSACRPWSTSFRARRSTSSRGTRTGDLPRQRAAARRGLQGRDRRGGAAHRGRGARRAAFAGDRPARSERAPGEPADRARHRHHDRGGGERRRQKEFEERTQLFMETLDLDEFFAQLLVSEGFTNLEEVAYVELDELLVIDGVDEDTATELQTGPANTSTSRRARPSSAPARSVWRTA